VHAAGIIDSIDSIDLVGKIGKIGRHVLDNLMPDRRLRTNAHTVKRAISKYNARGPTINRRTHPGQTHHQHPHRAGLDNRPGTLPTQHCG
jgi:hypothetical protein